MAFAPPVGCLGVVDIVAVRPGVIAEVALVRPMIDPARRGTLRHVILDRQMVDMHLAANAVLAGMIDHHVLDDLDAPRVRRVDQILIRRAGRFQARVDARPVVGVVAVVIQP